MIAQDCQCASDSVGVKVSSLNTILLVTLYTLLKLNELQFVVHIARNCTKLLEIVLKIVLVPFADGAAPTWQTGGPPSQPGRTETGPSP